EGNDWSIYYNTLKAASFPTIIPYITTLEPENKGALSLFLAQTSETYSQEQLREALFDLEGYDEMSSTDIKTLHRELAKESLIEFILSLQQGFIIASNSPDQLFSRKFSPPG